MCEQMCVIQNLDPMKEVRNKDFSQLIQFFSNACEQITKQGSSQLLILIDGLQDVNVDKSLIKDSLFTNNQISWLFSKILPPGVHLVVSVKRQISSIKVEGEDSILKKTSKQAQQAGATKKEQQLNGNGNGNAQVVVSFFLNNYNEKIPADIENCLFEFPFSFKKAESNEIIVKYLRNELEKHDRTLNEAWLQIIVNACLTQSINESASSSSDVTPIHFLYLNSLIKEVVAANPLNNDLKRLLNENEFPKDLESLIKFRISMAEF